MENEEKIDIIEVSEILDIDGKPIEGFNSTQNKKHTFNNSKFYIYFSENSSLLSKILMGLIFIIIILLIFFGVVFVIPGLILVSLILNIGKNILNVFKNKRSH